jgi:tRNA(Ile)-lysidine synthase
VEIGRVDVAGRAREAGESVEVAARRARHEFFGECAARHRCPRVVLAHHAEDQAETVLWNLLRGSHGPKGMAEIQNIAVGRRRIELHRPLLGHRRAELREFLRARGIRWREDATNATPHTPRNRLRHEALPLLAEIAGRDVVPALSRAAEAGTEVEAILNWALDQAKVVDPQGRLHLPALRALPVALRQGAIHRYLARHGVPDLSRATVLRCLGLVDVTAPSALDLPGAFRLRRRGGRMWVEGQGDHA